MIPVLYAELMDWKEVGIRHTLVWLVLSLGITGLVTMARPDWCAVVFTANLIWLSQLAGRQAWSRTSLDEWLLKTDLKVWRIVFGKIGAVLCITLYYGVITFPLWAIVTILWGVPLILFGKLALIWLGVSLCVTGIPLCTINNPDYADLLTIVTLSGWLVVTLVIRNLQPYNPLVQSYLLMRGENPVGYGWFCGYWIAALLVISGVMLISTRLRLRPEVSRP